MRIVAIICAKDEAPRIGGVLGVICPMMKTLVVDDGSVDGTGEVARGLGADVLRLEPNRGKGQAMKAGVDYCRQLGADIVLFADADLIGFRPEHVFQLLRDVWSGQFGMVVGMRDHSQSYGAQGLNDVARNLPLISGERAVRMDLLDRMPEEAWDGFGVETWMNHVVAACGAQIGTVILEGLSIVLKWEKEGLDRGISKMVDMTSEIVRAHQDAARYGQQALPAPVPASFTAQGASSEEVMRCLSKSIVEASAPFVASQLWTSEHRREIGKVIGKHMAMPIWTLACATAIFFFGPLAATMSFAGLILNVGFKDGPPRNPPRITDDRI